MPILSQDLEGLPHVDAVAHSSNHESDLVFLPSQQRSRDKSLFVMARDVSESSLESFLRVTIVFVKKLFGSVSKERKNLFANFIKVLDDTFT